MARTYLINQVQLVGALYLPGSVIDPAVGDPIAALQAAGARLAPATVPEIATAAALASSMRQSGATAAAMESVMVAAFNRYNEAMQHGWREQAEWHINALTGDDANDGLTEATALATHAELERRLEGVAVEFVYPIVRQVYVDSDLPEYVRSGWTAVYRGKRTVVLTGTLTAGTVAYAPATSTRGVIEDTSLPAAGFTPYVGRMFVLTSGPNAGAYGAIQGVNPLNAKQAYYQPLFDEAGYSSPAPVAGAGYAIYELTKIIPPELAPWSISLLVHGGDVHFRDIQIVSGKYGTVAATNAAATTMWGCVLGPNQPWSSYGGLSVRSASYADLIGCFLHEGVGIDTAWGSNLYLEACTIRQVDHTYGNIGFTFLPVVQLGKAAAPVRFAVGGSFTLYDWLAFFEHGSAAGGIVQIADGGHVDCSYSPLWGVDNAVAYAVNVGVGCYLSYGGASNLPAIDTAATADCLVGNVPQAYGALPFVNSTKMCGIIDSTA